MWYAPATMGFFKRLFAAKQPAPKGPEHALLLSIRLGNDEFGEPGEVEAMHELQDELSAAIARAKAGELDGDELGAGVCTIYMYGPDADRLWNAVAPVLEKHTFRHGSEAVKRFGAPGEAREEKINLHWEG